MTQTTFFILVYLASLVLCLTAGYITNWEDLHTVGDFICPLFNDYDERPWNICIWLPLTNTVLFACIAVVSVIHIIYEFFSRMVTEWTGIGKFVSKIWNRKVK